MHTFRKVIKPGTDIKQFQVGYFHPTTNNFIVLGVKKSATVAGMLVNYLNGGGGSDPFVEFSDEVIL